MAKKLVVNMFFLVLLVFSTVGAAYASCPLVLGGADARGNEYYCDRTGGDANYCYYSCECWGDCRALYQSAGLEAY